MDWHALEQQLRPPGRAAGQQIGPGAQRGQRPQPFAMAGQIDHGCNRRAVFEQLCGHGVEQRPGASHHHTAPWQHALCLEENCCGSKAHDARQRPAGEGDDALLRAGAQQKGARCQIEGPAFGIQPVQPKRCGRLACRHKRPAPHAPDAHAQALRRTARRQGSAQPITRAPIRIGWHDEAGRRRAIDLPARGRAFLQQHHLGATLRRLGGGGHAGRAGA